MLLITDIYRGRLKRVQQRLKDEAVPSFNLPIRSTDKILTPQQIEQNVARDERAYRRQIYSQQW